MARTKKVVKPEQVLEGLGDFDQFLDKMEKTKEPIITSITINPNGTIFGLCDNKIYVYDDFNHEWKVRS